ncbi:MAG: hypothetical protein MUF05_05820 [Candidatus Omnitrophica bacterium]|jgi:FKBP-type peptidyl-prolyl cis-trans isomerase (trigger factor)|nr:hypothetical protein [Candidatus Omnitrophota bacterium]
MNTEVKKMQDNKVEIGIKVTGEVVKNKFEDVFKKIGQEAKVPGFRQGHVPRDMLEKDFSAYAHQQVIQELIPELYDQAVEKESIAVVDLPQISEVNLDRENISFKAVVEVVPEIKLNKYKGLSVKYPAIEVTADELKRQIDSLKEQRKADVVDDDFAKGLCYPDLKALEKALERQIFVNKENQQRQKIEAQVIEDITKQLDFKVPQVMIDRQLEEMLKQAKVDLALRGMPKDQINSHEKEMIESLKPKAAEEVKNYLVLSAIAKEEKIDPKQHMPQKVMEFLFKNAQWSN